MASIEKRKVWLVGLKYFDRKVIKAMSLQTSDRTQLNFIDKDLLIYNTAFSIQNMCVLYYSIIKYSSTKSS